MYNWCPLPLLPNSENGKYFAYLSIPEDYLTNWLVGMTISAPQVWKNFLTFLIPLFLKSGEITTANIKPSARNRVHDLPVTGLIGSRTSNDHLQKFGYANISPN